MRRALLLASLLPSLMAPALASIASAATIAAPGDRRPGLLPATIPPPIVVTSTADRATAAVGERVTVVYSARIPAGAALKLESLVSPARPEGQSATSGFVLDFEPVEPLAVGKEMRTGLVDVRQTVRLAAFVAGETRIPGPVFSYSGPDGTKAVVRPPEVKVTVSSRLPADQEPEQVAPKPERPVRIPGRGPWFWASLAVALLAASGLVFWLVKRRRKKESAVEESAPPPPPPDVELEASLASLTGRAASLDGDARPFYTELTHATKRFLERHLGQPVLEWTTFETVRRLRESGTEPPREVALPDLLVGADRVKFGRAESTREDASRALENARHLLAWGRVRMAAQAAAEKAAEKAAAKGASKPAAPAAPKAASSSTTGRGPGTNR
ncbi:MAG TPA: hypothetical protein VE129_01470 [Thermoanaerobaculia bacterium]|nr:hypothetical protein [Thermoanaerobaculia bacterium]